jgi:arabinose-5-phosphate isomerase
MEPLERKLSDAVETARKTLFIEKEAIVGLIADFPEEAFRTCAAAIFSSGARVVVTGIGKSALVGQKIAATLNSTGTPALFMHAADAIHGDLGMIGPSDVVLCLSKSGDTPEIKALLPLLKRLGNPVVALTSVAGSELARRADHLLLAPIDREADPNNLAPTASTIVQMAMGDALAMALLSMRGFSPADFARLHPGGSLGKRLYLRVSDISSANERPAVPPEALLDAVILEITSKRLGATAVLDAEGEVIGIVTDGDLRRMLERGGELSVLCARELMCPSPRCLDEDSLAVEALALMREHKIAQVVALRNGRYAGMVHLHDLVREGIV